MATVRTTDFPLWAGVATVATFAPTRDDHTRAVQTVQAWLRHVDRVASTYRADSQLQTLNAAAGRTVTAGPTLTAMLTAALDIAQRTGGLVDPTIGQVTLRHTEPIRVARRVTYRDVDVRPTTSGAVVRVPIGVRLDLGATAKAWAADQSASIAATAANGGALVSLLGDVSISGPAPSAGWAVRVTDDHREGVHTSNRTAQTIALTSGGLATSGTTARVMMLSDGTPAAHIVDPRTLLPVDSPWRAVSVAAPSCLIANAASTAAVILGAGAPDWLERSSLPARLASRDGAPRFLGQWPAPLSRAA